MIIKNVVLEIQETISELQYNTTQNRQNYEHKNVRLHIHPMTS